MPARELDTLFYSFQLHATRCLLFDLPKRFKTACDKELRATRRVAILSLLPRVCQEPTQQQAASSPDCEAIDWEGCCVQIQGLEGKKELNGSCGAVQELMHDPGRHQVNTPSHDALLSVHLENAMYVYSLQLRVYQVLASCLKRPTPCLLAVNSEQGR